MTGEQMIRKIASDRSRRFMMLATLVVLGAIAAPLYAFGGSDKPGKSAEATLATSGGTVVGTVEFKQERGKVEVTAEFDSVPAGFHGFHVHTTGSCTNTEPTPGTIVVFGGAGGHLNPITTATHRDHAGDMPVLLVNADGTAEASFETDRFTVKELFDLDGSAVIVHASADNYANIPTRYVAAPQVTGGPDAPTLATGDAGGRFACGVVETTKKGHDNDGKHDSKNDHDDDDDN